MYDSEFNVAFNTGSGNIDTQPPWLYAQEHRPLTAVSLIFSRRTSEKPK